MSTSLRLTVVGLMITTAAALAMILFTIVNPGRINMPAETPPPLTTSYLVAARALPSGTLARDEDFVAKSVPVAQVPPGSIMDSPDARTSLRGALVRIYLDAGAPIVADSILRPRERGFLATVLEQGSRAVSVGVDPVSGVSGLIWPGDRVDVILIQELGDKAPLSRRVMGETVLGNVRIIAVDQDMAQGAPPAGNAAAGKLARTVTLQVLPEEAEKLAVAERLGKLLLSIRSAADQPSVANDDKVTTFGRDVSPALARTDEPVVASMLVIDGDKRQEVTFK